jgi:hypothetical protein
VLSCVLCEIKDAPLTHNPVVHLSLTLCYLNGKESYRPSRSLVYDESSHDFKTSSTKIQLNVTCV